MRISTIPLASGYTDSPANRGVLVKHAREAMASQGHPGEWHVQEIKGQSATVVLGVPAAAPGKMKVALAANFSPTRMPELERLVARQGLTITALHMDLPPGQRYAEAARVTPAVRVLRDALAAGLGKHPHELGLNSVWSAEGNVEKVWVRGLPSTMADEKLAAVIHAFLGRIPGGSPSWQLEVDSLSGHALLSFREPEKLPSQVLFREIALAEIDPSQRTTLPIGINSGGAEVVLDLGAGPHCLVVGESGSGKSVTSRLIMAQVLARGYELILADSVKMAAGLKAFIPYSKGFFVKDVQEVADAMDAIYEEVRRRVALIDDHDAEDWTQLPAGKVRPWMVVIDEYTGLVSTDKKPIGDPKDPVIQEMLEEWMSVTSAVARIQSKVGRIAKEARSSGIHILILTQRPDTTDIPGQVRTNLGSVVQLVAPQKPPTREAMGMIFPGDGPAEGFEIVKKFSDGKSRGLGLSFVDGGRLQGFRGGFIKPEEIVPYLEEIGVPPGIPLLPGRGYGKPKAAAPTPAPASGEFLPLDDGDKFPF